MFSEFDDITIVNSIPYLSSTNSDSVETGLEITEQYKQDIPRQEKLAPFVKTSVFGQRATQLGLCLVAKDSAEKNKQ